MDTLQGESKEVSEHHEVTYIIQELQSSTAKETREKSNKLKFMRVNCVEST